MDNKIRIKKIMKRDVVSVDVKSHVQHIAKKMLRHGIGSVVITDKKKPVGIVTKEDIFKKIVSRNIKPDDISIKELMTTPLITVPATEYTTNAVHKMLEMDIRRLPVVENEKLVGIVTDTDLIANLPEIISEFPVCSKFVFRRLPGVSRRYPGSSGGRRDKESNKSKSNKPKESE